MNILKILAFDTSTEWCSAALSLDGEVRTRAVHAGQKHSELLLPMVTALLDEAGLALRDLDLIAFGQGPGSFTGLRIACGVAQGLAFGAGLPVLGVVTLEALAEEAALETDGDRVVACLDARMREVYAAIYRRAGAGWQVESAPGLYAPAEAPLPEGEGYIGCGSGFAAYAEVLADRYAGRLSHVQPELHPHARAIARLAGARFAQTGGLPPEAAEPFYVRDKVALKTCERQ